MSTADSQLLVAASAIAHDLGLGGHPQTPLLFSRMAIVGLVMFAVLVSLYLPEAIFSRVLFAWIALGSAFGPGVYAPGRSDFEAGRGVAVDHDRIFVGGAVLHDA